MRPDVVILLGILAIERKNQLPVVQNIFLSQRGEMGDRTGLKKIDRTNGYEDGRNYMKVKQAKLAQQNDQIRDAIRQRSSVSRSEIFKGISISVNGRTKPTADELKRLILLNGGDYHPYYRYQTTKFMIATNLSMARMKLLRPDDRVVRPEWITDSIEVKCLLPYEEYQLFTDQPRGRNGSVLPIDLYDEDTSHSISSTTDKQLVSVSESYSRSYRDARQRAARQKVDATKSKDIRDMFSRSVRSISSSQETKPANSNEVITIEKSSEEETPTKPMIEIESTSSGPADGFNPMITKQNDQIRDAIRQRNSVSRSEIFKGISISVSGQIEPSADELKRLILLNGGDYHPYYRYQTTKFMIASSLSMARVKSLRPDDRVVRPEWITDSIQVSCLLPYEDYELFNDQPREINGSVLPIDLHDEDTSHSTSSVTNTAPQKVRRQMDIRNMFSRSIRSIGSSQEKKSATSTEVILIEESRVQETSDKPMMAQQNDQIRDAIRQRNSVSRSEIFKGISISVSGQTEPSADELKHLILLNGGDYHPYYRYQTTKFMIATNLSMARVKSLRPDDRVVRPEWITDSIQVSCLLPFEDYELFTNQPRERSSAVLPIDLHDEDTSHSTSSITNTAPQRIKGQKDIRDMFSKSIRSIDSS